MNSTNRSSETPAASLTAASLQIEESRSGEKLVRMPARRPHRMTVSVAIITKDEEENLRRTLESVKWADEIVVLDCGSTDGTCAIAREFGAKIFLEDWKGFTRQKNSCIEKCTGDLILSLDADEELTQEATSEIRRLSSLPDQVADGYYIRRRNLFLGRWLKHGGAYPDPKLRLFKRGLARFKERAVHEEMGILGGTAPQTLKGDLIHYSYPTLAYYTEHMNRYSSLGAEILCGKRRTSFNPFNIVAAPIAQFLHNYVFRLGFLDGREGFLFHLYHSVYVSWKYAKAWERARCAEPLAVPESAPIDAALNRAASGQ